MENFNREELKTIFKDILSIYSPTRNEKNVANYIVNFLEKLGAEIYLDNSYEIYGGNSPTVFAKIKGNVEGEGVTFSAHMDVVEPNENLKIVEEGNIIKTDGTTTLGGDDKAGIAAILYSIKYIVENKKNHQDIFAVFTPGEEKGMLGARNINWQEVYKNMTPAKNTIVVDNAGKSEYVAYKAPTCTNFRINITGKKAHAGLAPEEGINAIKVLSEIIAKMNTGRINELTTSNISQMSSDFPTNVVPDKATAYGEVRAHSDENVENMLNEYKKIAEEVSKEYKATFEMECEKQYPRLDTMDDLKFAKEFVEIYKKVGVDAKLQVIGGGSDANFFAGEGFNSIIIGVGMQKVHTTEEYLEVEEMIKTTKAIIEYLDLN